MVSEGSEKTLNLAFSGAKPILGYRAPGPVQE